MYGEFFLMLFLFLCSAFFSGSETAYMAVNRVEIRELAHQDDKRAHQVDHLLNDQTKLLTTILIGNNLVNIAASAIATSVAIEIFGSSGVGIATGVVTLLILIFGEITPKSYGNSQAVKYAKRAAPLLLLLERLFAPIIFLFTKMIKFLLGDDLISSAFLSEEEIRRFVNVSRREGVIKETEREMIQSVFDFDDTLVKEIMVPRIEISCVRKNEGLDGILKKAVETGHSRIPVYETTIDNIIGLIYVKDLLGLLLKNAEKNSSIDDFIKPIYFIPESKPINQLLAEMKKRKEHMAIVIDEYGGTAGLITIEDLLEEIVGDIQDEFDLEPTYIEIVNENELIVDGRIDIDDVNELLPEPLLEEEGFETVGGFILHFLNRLPDIGEKLSLDGLEFEIIDVTENRIKQVRIQTSKSLRFDDSRWSHNVKKD